MALNLRFLQKQGVDKAVAASGIGLNTVAGLVGHLSLIGIFIVWAGRDAFGSFRLPDPTYFLIGIVGVVLYSIGLVVAIPTVFLHTLVSSRARRLTQILHEEAAGILAEQAESQLNRG